MITGSMLTRQFLDAYRMLIALFLRERSDASVEDGKANNK